MNLRPPGYEPDELPSCSTPRHSVAFIGDIDYYTLFQQFCQEGAESFFAAEAEDENAAADLLSRKPAATPIHAPPRGATKRGVGNEAPARFQFTPLREGRLILDVLNLLGLLISIHAPPRGATASMSRCVPPRGDFNSRPSARGDSPRKAGETFRLDFNSRPSARGDHDAHRRGLVGTISIHAPPRGATRRIGKNRSRVLFQFTPIREGRLPTGKL